MSHRATTRTAALTVLFIALALFGLVGGRWLRLRMAGTVPPHLTAYFPAVSEGNPVIMRTPEGQVIVIDTGSEADSKAVIALLERIHTTTIDLLVLTSHQYTALGGVPAILESPIHVRLVWQTEDSYNGRSYRAAEHALQQMNVPVRTVHADDSVEMGPVPLRLLVLWPPEHGAGALTDPLSSRVDYGSTAFLLQASGNGATEQSLLASSGQRLSSAGQYCILHVANHGSATATTAELLRWSTPEAAVISSGPANIPDPKTMHRLQAAGASIWRTDTVGTVTIDVDGTSAPEINAGSP